MCFRPNPDSAEIVRYRLICMRPLDYRPQIKRERKIRIPLCWLDFHFSGGMTVAEKSAQPAALGFVRVDRKRDVIAPAGMGDMIRAAAE